MGEKAYENIINNFTKEVIVKKYINLFDSLKIV